MHGGERHEHVASNGNQSRIAKTCRSRSSPPSGARNVYVYVDDSANSAVVGSSKEPDRARWKFAGFVLGDFIGKRVLADVRVHRVRSGGRHRRQRTMSWSTVMRR